MTSPTGTSPTVRDGERDALRQKLESEVAVAGAADLIAHHRRGALLLVTAAHSLVDVGVAFAKDDTKQVKAWLTDGSLARPTPAELADACLNSAQFRFLILQPYVLLQRDAGGPPAAAKA